MMNSMYLSNMGPIPFCPHRKSVSCPISKIAEVVGWQDGETPSVPDGLVATVYANDLANPRTVHTLPNGDVLVVQSKAPPGKPLNRPKDIIRGFIMSMAAGGGTPPGKDTHRLLFCATPTGMEKLMNAAIF